MYRRSASRVLFLSDLDWFWSSKRQNNWSHISRSTLSEAAQLYLILHRSCFSLRSDHQMIFSYVHCSSAEEWSSSLNQHCIICLDHLHLIWLRRIIGDIERPLICISFYVSNYCTVIKISLIYITSSRIASYKYQHLTKLYISAPFGPLNKTELFFLHILTISDDLSYTSLMDLNKKHICKLYFTLHFLSSFNKLSRF